MIRMQLNPHPLRNSTYNINSLQFTAPQLSCPVRLLLNKWTNITTRFLPVPFYLNMWEFLEWLHNWQLLKKGSAPWVSEWVSEWVRFEVLVEMSHSAVTLYTACLAYSSTMNMEIVRGDSKTSINFNQTTWCNIPEGSTLLLNCSNHSG
jgi:hypothetical protein